MRLSRLLPQMYIIKQDTNGQLSYSLVGSALEALFRKELTGSHVLDLCATAEQEFTRVFLETLLQNRCGGVAQRDLFLDEHALIAMHSLLLPLQDARTGNVNQLVGIADTPNHQLKSNSVGDIGQHKATVHCTRSANYIDLDGRPIQPAIHHTYGISRLSGYQAASV